MSELMGMAPTAEDIELRWRSTRDRAMGWVPPSVPTLVVAPHPHDEALQFGGLISVQRARGVPVTIVAVTDGEAAYSERVLDVDLRTLRPAEQAAAVRELGADESSLVRLRLPDGGVGDHLDTLTESLRELACGHGLIAAPWAGHDHPDQQACGEAAHLVARATGTPLVSGVFWAWRDRQPTELDGALLRMDLPVLMQDRRHRAVAQHRSMVGEVVVRPPRLSHDDLEPIRWDAEYYLDLMDAEERSVAATSQPLVVSAATATMALADPVRGGAPEPA